MLRMMLKSKVHRVTATQTDLDYDGSLTLDATLMEAADLLPHEQIHVLNITNGERFVTYLIKGERDSGIVGVNGAAAHLVSKGDLLIIVSYFVMGEENTHFYTPRVVLVDENNRIKEIR